MKPNNRGYYYYFTGIAHPDFIPDVVVVRRVEVGHMLVRHLFNRHNRYQQYHQRELLKYHLRKCESMRFFGNNRINRYDDFICKSVER